MKIRMQGNSVRLRLSQTEVQHLAENGYVESSVQFAPAPEHTLVYSLKSDSVEHMVALYSNNRIEVVIPSQLVKTWAETDLVGLENVLSLTENNSLRLLVEKDFKCQTVREGEDESDNFPNPGLSC